jgi:RimJ/RimL family protein N-acetyltransferase
VAVTLHLYAADDFPLLQALNTPEMMTYLGGPESPEKLASRHEKYQRLLQEGEARMFRIAADESPAVGTIAWWRTQWHEQPVHEAGWSVATPFQRRGYAVQALELLLRDAADHGDAALLVATPHVDNAASNAVCLRAGFSFREEQDGEYPPGNPVRCNVWTFDLAGLRGARALGYVV